MPQATYTSNYRLDSESPGCLQNCEEGVDLYSGESAYHPADSLTKAPLRIYGSTATQHGGSCPFQPSARANNGTPRPRCRTQSERVSTPPSGIGIASPTAPALDAIVQRRACRPPPAQTPVAIIKHIPTRQRRLDWLCGVDAVPVHPTLPRDSPELRLRGCPAIFQDCPTF